MTAEDRNEAERSTESPLVAGEQTPWRDPTRPPEERVKALLGQLTLEEKVAQLYSVWLGTASTTGEVAPFQHDMVADGENFDWEKVVQSGLGQLTRPFGTAPIEPVAGADRLAGLQQQVIANSRLGIPALAHEECLTGWTTWKATVYPTPLAWGATFDSELIERMAAQIGSTMCSLGIHQGLSPVLDVTRDPRWGRTEETIGEDPYLVGTIATAYVKGLQSAGVHATLKHFVGYSASRAGRNFGPVSLGPRELADLLFPFEMAVREGRARSIMASYTALDGMPSHADSDLLTGLLRDSWGFEGVVVADYFGVAFLQALQGVAGDLGEAAGSALAAGLDVELPMVHCFGEPLLTALRSGTVEEGLVDRAVQRVLMQKCELGLLDADWDPVPPALAAARDSDASPIDLDPPHARALARRIAEESVVLLSNSAETLPLAPNRRLALVGPLADDTAAMLGCYTFPRHVGSHHPEVPIGLEIPTVLEALRGELPEADITYTAGCEVNSPDTSGFAAAVEAARNAEVCVLALGDHAGLFGQATSGEGCDVTDLKLPGVQEELLEAVLESGTPVVLLLMAGRPYSLGRHADQVAAAVQAFFPGEEGGPAVARVLSGRISPSGRLPVSVPRTPGGQPATYLTSKLGHATEVSSVDPSPLYPFGHGLSYTTFEWADVRVDGRAPAEGETVELDQTGTVRLSVNVHNTGSRPGADVVQLYLHDPVSQVAQPVVRLIGYARVEVEPGEARRVEFEVHPDLFGFVGRDGSHVVEPGDVELRIAASSSDVRHTVRGRVTGAERKLGSDRRMLTEVNIT